MEENGKAGFPSILFGAGEEDPVKDNTEMSKLVAFDRTLCIVSDIATKNSIHATQLLSNGDHSKDISMVSGDENPSEITLVQQLKDRCIESGIRTCTEFPKQMAAEEKLIGQSCSSTITGGSNNFQVTSSNNTEVILSRTKENITYSKDENEKMCEIKNCNETENCVMETKTDKYLPLNTLSNVKSLAIRENKKRTKSENESLQYYEVKSHRVSGEREETCVFCSEKNTKVRTEYFDNSKDLNFEVKRNEAIQELTCCICSHKLVNDKGVLQNNHKNEDGVCTEIKNTSGSETDLIRPASSVSNNSSNFSASSEKKSKREEVEETDLTILSRRQKQIDYGKNTLGYQRYKELVPKDKRTRQHPHTPPKSVKYSRRAWDGLIKAWRRKLHDWDPPKLEGSDAGSMVSSPSLLTLSDDSDNLADIPTFSLEESVVNDIDMNGVSNKEDSKLHKLK